VASVLRAFAIGATWVHLFATVQPATGARFALIMPEVSTEAMNLFLAEFSTHLAADKHALISLDQAGWHGAKALHVPVNITLLPLSGFASGIG
jgi:hypothetical protein